MRPRDTRIQNQHYKKTNNFGKTTFEEKEENYSSSLL